MLAIRSNEKLWVWTDQGLCQVRADRLTRRLTSWVADAVRAMGPRGHGSTIGPSLRPLGEPGKGYWLLAQHCYRGVGLLRMLPAGTALECQLVRVADPVAIEGVSGAGGTGPVEVRSTAGTGT